LIAENVYQDIIRAVDLNSRDLIMEVGPGLGTLTTGLLATSQKVISIELDRKFLPVLNKIAAVSPNLKIINQDILKIKNEEIIKLLTAKEINDGIYDYKVIANLPYNISSFFLRKFLAYPPRPKLLILLLQAELAERLVAKPGQMSLLSVMGQFYGEPIIDKLIAKDCFWPQPQVDSALVKIKTINYYKKYQLAENFDETGFFKLVKVGFAARRKKLKNNLQNVYQNQPGEIDQLFKKLDIKESIRAQELSIDRWIELFLNLTL